MINASLPPPVAAVLFAATLSVGAESEREPVEKGGRSGLVLHYTFDSRSGRLVANEVADRHHGRCRIASFCQSSAAAGHSLLVRKNDLQSGYVETADHRDFHGPTFTVAAWIKLRRHDSSGSVVCKHDWPRGTCRGYVLRCYTAEFVNFTIGAGGWVRANGTTPVPANRWVHVAGTFDGDFLRVFFNGRLEGTTKVQRPYTPSPLPLRIGYAAFVMERKRKFDGQIDDVMIWNRALSAAELRAVYDRQRPLRPLPLTPADVLPLIEQLGSTQFEERCEAERRLIELDTEVLPLLHPHRKGNDLEVVWRLRQIEKAINRNLPPTRTAPSAAFR